MWFRDWRNGERVDLLAEQDRTRSSDCFFSLSFSARNEAIERGRSLEGSQVLSYCQFCWCALNRPESRLIWFREGFEMYKVVQKFAVFFQEQFFAEQLQVYKCEKMKI
jgi:hypothetical protein